MILLICTQSADKERLIIMMNPDLRLLLKGNISRYSLVTATAKRAREIVDDAKLNNEIIEEKPISLAIDELLDGEYSIKEPEDIQNI